MRAGRGTGPTIVEFPDGSDDVRQQLSYVGTSRDLHLNLGIGDPYPDNGLSALLRQPGLEKIEQSRQQGVRHYRDDHAVTEGSSSTKVSLRVLYPGPVLGPLVDPVHQRSSGWLLENWSQDETDGPTG